MDKDHIILMRYMPRILAVIAGMAIALLARCAFAEPPISVASYEEMLAYNAAVKAKGGGPRDYIYSICTTFMIINDAPSMYGFHSNPDKRYYTNGRCGPNDVVTVTYEDEK